MNDAVNIKRRTLNADNITLAHGSGGKAMRDLIEDVFVSTFDNEYLDSLEDQARFDIENILRYGDRLAMTTDSYVVDPLFFPGGDIGKLAITGTVNDLAVGGARPLYIACGMIIEEGLSVNTLREIAASMKTTADDIGVHIVTGDTKVVHKNAADKLFINTSGIGVIPENVNIQANQANPGDIILINGFIGDHGAAIVDARGELSLENTIKTDCQPLNRLVHDMLLVCPDIRCMRDATRGGIAAVLNEFAESSHVGIEIDESTIPIRDEVRGMCEILGLDPLYLANEGKIVTIVPEHHASEILDVMLNNPAGNHGAVIGRVTVSPADRVVLKTGFGGDRIVDMLIGEQLPRIC